MRMVYNDLVFEIIKELLLPGIILCFILLVHKFYELKLKKYSDFLVLGTISLILIELFYAWLYVGEQIFYFPHFLRLNTILSLSVAPFIYFLILSFEIKNFRFNKYHIIHLLPAVTCIVYFSPLLFQSETAKIDYIKAMYSELSQDSIVWGIIRRVQQFCYLIGISFFLMKRKSNNTPINLISILFYISFFAIFISSLIRIVFHFSLMNSLYDSFILVVYIIILVFLGLSKPSLWQKKISPLKCTEIDEEIIFKLENAIREKVYRNTQLTIKDLADYINVPSNELSRVINSRFGKNFNEFINIHRIEHSKSILSKIDNKIYTIESLAMDSGFSSISTFNYWFKKVTRKTPRSFRV